MRYIVTKAKGISKPDGRIFYAKPVCIKEEYLWESFLKYSSFIQTGFA